MKNKYQASDSIDSVKEWALRGMRRFSFMIIFCILMVLLSGVLYISKNNHTPNPIEEIEHPGRKKVAVLYIATGNYIKFWDQFYQAAEKFFLPAHDKTYFLFTDKTDIQVPENVVVVPVAHETWPFITLKRYHFFSNQKRYLRAYDYIFFMNANLIFQAPIGDEILPTKAAGLMVAQHSGYWDAYDLKWMPYERNERSEAYVASKEGKYYFTGGFYGGTSSAFLTLSETIANWTDIDLSHGRYQVWHDESFLNRYMIDYMRDHQPVILLPDYIIPEERLSAMKANFPGGIKGILLDKSRRGGHGWFRQFNPAKSKNIS